MTGWQLTAWVAILIAVVFAIALAVIINDYRALRARYDDLEKDKARMSPKPTDLVVRGPDGRKYRPEGKGMYMTSIGLVECLVFPLAIQQIRGNPELFMVLVPEDAPSDAKHFFVNWPVHIGTMPRPQPGIRYDNEGR
jgi:hypothetical protein